MKAEIIGSKELIDKLNKLSNAVRGKVIENSLVAGGLLISNSAKNKAPYKTGTLRRSIHVGGHTAESAPDFTPKDVAGSYSDIGGNQNDENSASVLIGTNLEYAKYQEYGTSKMAARPFLRPALDEEKENVKDEIGAALKVLIDKAVGK